LQRILNDAQSSIITENNLPSFPEWGNTELNRLQNLLKINPLVNNHIKSNGILVSGATGLLGRYIVQELLCTTERPIYCLLRSPSSSDQHARLQVLLKELGMPEGKMQRLHVIKGDLTSDNLGLGIDSLIFLRGNISDIVHCAADTNMLSPYEKLANTNVLGTLKLINLALENNTRFHFISSLALFDTKDFLTRITPKSKVIEIDNLDSGYLQSKWIIEALLDKIATSNLNVIVYRCGRLWGQTKNRQEASNDFIYQFLNLCLRIKKFPDVPMQLEISSADGIARKIVHMITTPGVQYAPTYHLCSNKSYTTNEVYTSMKMRSDDLTRVDSDTWMETLKAHMQKSPDDTQAVKIYAVVKSLSLPGAIDNLAIDEHIISPEFLDDSAQSHITLDAMIDAVMEQ
jgi:nonribosomal peptide synthetase MxcG